MRAFLLRLACAALLGLATPWAWAATVSVQPGQDLQAAITAAEPGDVVADPPQRLLLKRLPRLPYRSRHQ